MCRLTFSLHVCVRRAAGVYHSSLSIRFTAAGTIASPNRRYPLALFQLPAPDPLVESDQSKQSVVASGRRLLLARRPFGKPRLRGDRSGLVSDDHFIDLRFQPSA